MKLKPLLLLQPYPVAHLRQNLASQPQVVSQPPNTVMGTGYGPPDVRPNKPTSDVKGKRREADSALSRTQLDTIPEDLGTSEGRGLGPSSLARSPSHPGSLTPSANVPLFSGASNSAADIYRRPEPPSQYSYPYNYHYSIPSTSSSKSTPIPPKITANSPSSSSTHRSQSQHYTTIGSTSKFLESNAHQIYSTSPSQSQSLFQASPTVSPQRRRSRDYANHPAGTTHNAPNRRSKHGIAPLTSDARTEHVLLAARRIGRERAGLVAGILQHVEREKEIHARDLEFMKARQDLERSERERLERLANGTSGLAYYRSTDVLASPQRNTGRGSAPVGVPRTPKRGGGVGATHYPGLSGALSNSPMSSPTRVPTSAGPSTFVFVNTSAAAGTSGYSGGGVMNTPSQRGSVFKSGGTAKGGSRNLLSNPPTPLDSLLDAARMIDDGAGRKAKTNGTRKALEHLESPVPKRRRVSSSGSKTVGRGAGVAGTSTGGKVTRVRSALDVLADQAAAVFDEPGQTNSGRKGKEKRKAGDEGLGSGGVGVGNDQECDDVDQQDDPWPQGSTSVSASASSVGPSRGRSRAKTASINTRAIAESTSSSSMSLRPVRQASQKSLASQNLQSPPFISTTAAGDKGKSRGRPKGSKSRPRSDVSIKSSSTSKMNPSLGLRVIASTPTYLPLDVAIALQPQKDRRREKEKERERSGEHSQRTTVNVDRSPGMGGLRPVVEWGEKGAEEDEGDEDVKAEGEYVSLVVTGGELGLGQQNDHVERKPDADGAIVVETGNDEVTESLPTLKIIVWDMEKDAETQLDTSSNAPTNGHISPADADLPPIDDADAEADLDDEDAEGEQEEEEDDENADAEAGQGRSSRSRTPPPPDPPHSGAPSDSNDNDPDADADAEGEMEFEENEELPPTSTSSAVNQTALSVVMGQVPPCNLDGSFLDDDLWLIKVFWMESDISFGYNTTSTHVLISAMVPESLPSSLSMLSDLSDKISLHLPYPEQRRKSVVSSREGWWRNIDVKGEKENLSLVCTPDARRVMDGLIDMI